MKCPAAAITAILSRLRLRGAPTCVVRSSLRYALRAESSDRKLAPTIRESSKSAVDNTKAAANKVNVHIRFDRALLAKSDAAAHNQGITRTAWLHRAAFDALEDRVSSPAD